MLDGHYPAGPAFINHNKGCIGVFRCNRCEFAGKYIDRPSRLRVNYQFYWFFWKFRNCGGKGTRHQSQRDDYYSYYFLHCILL